jgi:hypothetical protein
MREIFGADISCTMQDANDINAIRGWTIENHVASNGETADFSSEFSALTSGGRVVGEHLDDAVEAPDECCGRPLIVLGDETPDV